MPHTILAVDDSATMRKVLEITFEGSEFRLVTADSAATALDKVRAESPDLVIADLSLLPADGYELCGTIKQAQPKLPVLLLSSKHNPFDEGKGAVADDHIDKPFDTQIMTDKVRKMLEGAPARAADAERPTTETPPAFGKPEAPARAATPAHTPAAGPLGGLRKIGVPDTQRPGSPATPRLGATPLPGAAGSRAPHLTVPARRTMAFGSPQVPADLAATRPGAGPGLGRTLPLPSKSDQAASHALGRGATRSPAASVLAEAPPMTSPLGTPGLRQKARVGAETLPGVKVAEEQKRVAEAAAAPAHPVRPAWPLEPPARRAAPEPTPAPTPVAADEEPAPAASSPAAIAPALDAEVSAKVAALGLTAEQAAAVVALSRELVERVVWEVVPPLAELMIKEELARLTRD